MRFSRRQFIQHGAFATLSAALSPLRADEKPVTKARDRLRVGTFYGYENSSVVSNFQRDSGVTIQWVMFENTEDVLAELVRNEHQLDVAISSDFMLPHLHTLGLIQPLQFQWLPHLDATALDRRFTASAHHDEEWLAWPNDWGTTGILYYRSKIKFEPKSWQDFFALIAQHPKRVSVPDDQTTLIGTALKALGYSFNDTQPAHLLGAAKLLQSVRPFVRSIDSDTDETILRDVMAMGWSDTAYDIQKSNPDLVYVLPPEGGELWSDWYAITRHCHDIRLAHEFLDYLFTPQHIVEEVINSGHSPVDKRVFSLLPEAIRNNAILFPTADVIKNMELANQSTLREPLRGEIFAQFKRNVWDR